MKSCWIRIAIAWIQRRVSRRPTADAATEKGTRMGLVCATDRVTALALFFFYSSSLADSALGRY